MKTTIVRSVPCIWFVFVSATSIWAQHPVFPVKISENGRYFADRNNDPVFWLGTTQWQIFREYTLDEARTILLNPRASPGPFLPR